jgi:hypothetical protein
MDFDITKKIVLINGADENGRFWEIRVRPFTGILRESDLVELSDLLEEMISDRHVSPGDLDRGEDPGDLGRSVSPATGELRIAIAPGTLFDPVYVFQFNGTKSQAKKFVELMGLRVQCTGMEYYKKLHGEETAKSVTTGRIVGWLPLGEIESSFV